MCFQLNNFQWKYNSRFSSCSFYFLSIQMILWLEDSISSFMVPEYIQMWRVTFITTTTIKSIKQKRRKCIVFCCLFECTFAYCNNEMKRTWILINLIFLRIRLFFFFVHPPLLMILGKFTSVFFIKWIPMRYFFYWIAIQKSRAWLCKVWWYDIPCTQSACANKRYIKIMSTMSNKSYMTE